MELAVAVQSRRVFQEFGNVNVVGKSYAVNRRGASALASVLHAAALLLKISPHWDWFTTLSSSDYPLLTQDDILYAFIFLSRDLNFVLFTNSTNWTREQKISQFVVDPSLHQNDNSLIFYAPERREAPGAFNIFGGSPWMILSRGFIEHCVKGWDNLPRKLLMYFSNVVSPLESYFHTVLCNSEEFQNTTVNSDLRYIVGETAIEGKPPSLNMSNYYEFVSSRAAFARTFKEGDPVLEEIDNNILNRSSEGVVPGNWCEHGYVNRSLVISEQEGDYCSTWDDIDIAKPGIYGAKLRKYLQELTEKERLVKNQCRGHVM